MHSLKSRKKGPGREIETQIEEEREREVDERSLTFALIPITASPPPIHPPAGG